MNLPAPLPALADEEAEALACAEEDADDPPPPDRLCLRIGIKSLRFLM